MIPPAPFPALSSMDGEAVRGRVLGFCSARRVVARDEVDEVHKLCEALKAYLVARGKALLASEPTRAVLFSYGSDATPLMTRKVFRQSHAGVTAARNLGKPEEFLIERGFIKLVTAGGDVRMVSICRDPVSLAEGKTAWHMLMPMVRFFPMVQKLGHRGIVVSHYVFDRCAWSSLSRLARQRHDLFHASRAEEGVPEADVMLTRLKDWFVTSPCSNHDAQNALKWGMKSVGHDEEISKKLHVAVEALRNSFDAIHGCMASFVSTYLAFVDDPPGSRDQAYAFWTNLSVDPDVANVLADLNLRWESGRLLASSRRRFDEDLLQQISYCLVSVCRFKSFTDSRWVTVGDSCRSLVAALALGLREWVALARRIPKTSDYWIHGFYQLDDEASLVAVVAAVISPICDSVLVELLEDDRVARRLACLESALESEIRWVREIDDFTWQRLATASPSVSARTLRTQCLLAGSTICAFLDMRIFREARKYPWKLVAGDVSANLDELERGPAVADPTTSKIKTLLGLGFNRHSLVEGVERLGDVSWSTNVHEQGHASASLLRGEHPMYSSKTLTARAMLHMSRAFFTKLAKDRAAARLERSASQLSKKEPLKARGRQLFLAGMMESARERSGGQPLTQAVKTQLMSSHAKWWSRLSPDVRAKYDAAAAEKAVASCVDIADELGQVKRDLVAAHQRLTAERYEAAQQCRISSCRFSCEDLDGFAAFVADDRWSRSAVESLRQAAVAAPMMPSAEVKAELGAMGDPPVLEERALPAWAKPICAYRDYFARCIVITEAVSGTRAFAFLYAMKTPQWVGLLELEEEEVTLPAPRPLVKGQPLLVAMARNPDRRFRVVWGSHVFASDLDIDDPKVYVLPNVCAEGEGHLVSAARAVSLEDFVVALPEQAPQRAPRAAHADRAPRMGSTMEMESRPWLRKYLKRKGTLLVDSDESDTVAAKPEAVPLADDEVEAVFKALEAKRLEWACDAEDVGAAFLTRVLGGKWTAENLGLVADAIQGYASTNDAKEWCKLYGVQTAARFNFARYGEPVCAALAQYWASAMGHFYSIWARGEDKAYVYSRGDHESVPLASALADLAVDLDAEHNVWARFEELKRSWPKAPRLHGPASGSGAC